MGSLFLLIAIYFLPTIIAFSRHYQNREPIFILNLFLGWTVIGWICLLAWAFGPLRDHISQQKAK
jgi:hypothetical protein